MTTPPDLLRRLVVLGLAAGAATAGLGAVVLPDVARLADPRDFTDLLVGTCALAAVLAGCALTWDAAALAVAGLRGRLGTTRLSGGRRLVLALCGAALGSALLVEPASATTAPPPTPEVAATELPADALLGLTPPDRVSGAAPGDGATGTGTGLATEPTHEPTPEPEPATEPEPTPAPAPAPEPAPPTSPPPPPAPATPARDSVRVGAGDSLWSIAADVLGPGAPRSEVARYWLRLQETNDAALAGHPDLIHPGQHLRLPPHPAPKEPS